MSDFVFTRHAREQMHDRQIPEVAVYHVVEHAESTIERDDGCTEYVGDWQGLNLMVVLCGDREPRRVRTVIRMRGRFR